MVNLFLNRAAKLVSVESWLPYDGKLLRTVEDPLFHAHYEQRQQDGELPRIDALAATGGRT